MHEAIQRVLSIHMRHSNNDFYILTVVKKKLNTKPQAVFKKMNPSDTKSIKFT